MKVVPVYAVMKDASEFPKFCPSCGQRRQVHEFQKAPAVKFIGPMGVEQAHAVLEYQAIPYCTRCGFLWESMGDAAASLKGSLSKMSDSELWNILSFFNGISKGLATTVADRTKCSLPSVGQVMSGQKTSAPMRAAILTVLRERLAEKDDLGQSINEPMKIARKGRAKAILDSPIPPAAAGLNFKLSVPKIS